MSDRIIRLGGSHIRNRKSIENLKGFLEGSGDRHFIVFSSISEIAELVEKNITNVFETNRNEEEIIQQFNELYFKITDDFPSGEFKELVHQFVRILDGIALIGDYSEALRDQVLTFAEKFSAEILRTQWDSEGSEATLLWPEEIGLTASADFGNATYLTVNTEKLQNLSGGIYFLSGSYGITDFGKISRTGKAAADYTAAFITKCLKAEKLELWGLDFDFTRADAKVVVNPQRINRLTYSEASELAYFDHYSLHPRTVEPLEPEHIPIHILNTATPAGEVTTVVNTETFVEDQIVKSVAYSDDISLLKLDGPGVGLKPGILAKVTSQLNDAGINIKSVITSQISINMILEKEKGDKAERVIRKLGFPSVQQIKLIKDISLIGVIGHGMQQNYGVSARIFNAVAQNKINVLLSGSGASDLVSYLVVKNSDKEKSVREIYNAFFKQN